MYVYCVPLLIEIDVSSVSHFAGKTMLKMQLKVTKAWCHNMVKNITFYNMSLEWGARERLGMGFCFPLAVGIHEPILWIQMFMWLRAMFTLISGRFPIWLIFFQLGPCGLLYHSFTCFLKYAQNLKRLDWIYIQIHHLGSHPGKWSFSVRSADTRKNCLMTSHYDVIVWWPT